MRSWLIAAAAIVVIGLIVAGRIFFVFWNQFVPIAAMGINYARYLNAPAGTIATEANAAWKAAEAQGAAPAATSPAPSEGDWPSYNKTLTSNRFSELSQINRTNAEKLKVLCTYDTGAVYRLQFRVAGGGRRADLRDRVRHLLHRSFDVPARTGAPTRTTFRPRRRRSIAARRIWTACFSAAPKTPVSSPMISRPANASGRRDRRPEEGRERPGGSDRLERFGFHRQRRRRHQGREGAHVCA